MVLVVLAAGGVQSLGYIANWIATVAVVAVAEAALVIVVLDSSSCRSSGCSGGIDGSCSHWFGCWIRGSFVRQCWNQSQCRLLDKRMIDDVRLTSVSMFVCISKN